MRSVGCQINYINVVMLFSSSQASTDAGVSRPDLSYFFANPDKIGNKIIFADYDSKYVLKYIWRVPHVEVRGK